MRQLKDALDFDEGLSMKSQRRAAPDVSRFFPGFFITITNKQNLRLGCKLTYPLYKFITNGVFIKYFTGLILILHFYT